MSSPERSGDNVVVTQNDHALALVSRRAWATGRGHVLVVPKAHYEHRYDLEGDDVYRAGFRPSAHEERLDLAARRQTAL